MFSLICLLLCFIHINYAAVTYLEHITFLEHSNQKIPEPYRIKVPNVFEDVECRKTCLNDSTCTAYYMGSSIPTLKWILNFKSGWLKRNCYITKMTNITSLLQSPWRPRLSTVYVKTRKSLAQILQMAIESPMGLSAFDTERAEHMSRRAGECYFGRNNSGWTSILKDVQSEIEKCYNPNIKITNKCKHDFIKEILSKSAGIHEGVFRLPFTIYFLEDWKSKLRLRYEHAISERSRVYHDELYAPIQQMLFHDMLWSTDDTKIILTRLKFKLHHSHLYPIEIPDGGRVWNRIDNKLYRLLQKCPPTETYLKDMFASFWSVHLDARAAQFCSLYFGDNVTQSFFVCKKRLHSNWRSSNISLIGLSLIVPLHISKWEHWNNTDFGLYFEEPLRQLWARELEILYYGMFLDLIKKIDL